MGLVAWIELAGPQPRHAQSIGRGAPGHELHRRSLQSVRVEGHATISSDILASYAADAAREVAGVSGLVERPLQRQRAVRVTEEEDGFRVELHLAVAWGASIPAVGAEVRGRVRDYLRRMADLDVKDVEVVVDEIAAA